MERHNAMNPAPPNFESFEDAEKTMKDHVLSLCNTYSNSIKHVLPTLKKSIVAPKVLDEDKQIFNQLYDEGNDHLHNLIQLKIELNNTTPETPYLILEISAEVLANTVHYLNNLTSTIEATTLYAN